MNHPLFNNIINSHFPGLNNHDDSIQDFTLCPKCTGYNHAIPVNTENYEEYKNMKAKGILLLDEDQEKEIYYCSNCNTKYEPYIENIDGKISTGYREIKNDRNIKMSVL